MKPSELLQTELERRYLGKRILGYPRNGGKVPFVVARVDVSGDGCDGIEVMFWSIAERWPAVERLADGSFTDPVPAELICLCIHNEELPEILPES